MHNLTRGLLQLGHTVKVLCISTPKQPLELKQVPADHAEQTRMEGVFVDTSVNIVDAFTDLITSDNYNISRFFSPDMDIRLIRLLTEETFDVVQLESLFMTPYIPTIRRYSKAHIVLRSHNLEHVIQDRIASGERNLIKRPYRRFLANQLKAYEMEVLERVDGVAAISPSDAAHFLEHCSSTPVTTIPFGVDPSEYPFAELLRRKKPELFHLGSMDWSPNEEGVRWLLSSVWPKVMKKRPYARLNLAGNKMPKDLVEATIDGVRIKGRVKDALAYMAAGDIMVVPLFSAGGMRVKIIEGMAMGKAIIATPIGAEGIAHTNGKNILLARTIPEFTDAIVGLLDDPDRVAELGLEARKLVMTKYANEHIVRDLVAFYKHLGKA